MSAYGQIEENYFVQLQKIILIVLEFAWSKFR